MEDAKKIVALGYDRIAERYETWASHVRIEERQRYIGLLLKSLPAGSRVLELGCGSGVLVTKALAQRFQVTGIDISKHQIGLARRAVPSAQFICADMSSVEFAPASFDAVAAFYSIVHVPRAEHPELFCRVFRWLRPGGFLLATLGVGNKKVDYEPDWLGVPMYWSSFDAAGAREGIDSAGFRILVAKEETADEGGIPVTFLWVWARRPDLPR
jgi:ubiquinone/menaquinone biosynthesis C-methylase UbiE